jgi:hypothetical protein
MRDAGHNDYAHPELLGISFKALPHEIMTNFIYVIDLCNIDSARWLLQRPSLADYHEKIQDFEQNTQMAHSEAIVSPYSGLPAPFVNVDSQKMDSALAMKALRYSARSKKKTDGEVVISNMTTPFHDAAKQMSTLSKYYSMSLKMIRNVALDTDDDSYTKLVPQHRLVVQQMHSMLNLEHNQKMPISTRNICNYINNDASGFFGKKPTLIRRIFKKLAPDMESGCNAMAYALIMLEQLGCSSMHSTCYLVFQAATQTMASIKGLSINPVLHGVGGAGKTHAIVNIVMKFMLIAGTSKVEGYSSRLAMLGASDFVIDVITLIDEGLDYVLSTGGDNGPSNVGPQESTLKLRLSESVISSRTLAHIDGKKVTITQESLAIGAMVFLTNAGSLPRTLGQALLDRMIDIEVPSVSRKHKGITDKISADTSDANCDHVRGNISAYFKHLQAFAWLVGKATTFFDFMDVDLSTFAPICKQYEHALSKLGVKLAARDIEKACMIAKERAKEAVYFSEFCSPHGRMTGYMDVDLEEFFDAQHTIEGAFIVSEAMARSSMSLVLTKHNRVSWHSRDMPAKTVCGAGCNVQGAAGHRLPRPPVCLQIF